MNPKERAPLSEVTFGDVYSKAREILDLHGHPGIRPTLQAVPRPGGRPRITSGADIPITEAPIVPIQIASNDYRLWIRSEDDSQPYNPNGAIELSVHFQQLPYGFYRTEYDSEGHVSGYWYKPIDDTELKHMAVVRSRNLLPKELKFGWYIAKAYEIKPNSINSEVPNNVPPEIVEGLGDSNDFLLGVLEEMQTKL